MFPNSLGVLPKSELEAALGGMKTRDEVYRRRLRALQRNDWSPHS